MITALVLTTYMLGVMRLTRLINRDTITDPIRIWALKTAPTLGYFLSCPWCVGLWLSAAAVVYPWHYLGYEWPILAALALSTSFLVGIVSQLDRDDIEVVVEQ